MQDEARVYRTYKRWGKSVPRGFYALSLTWQSPYFETRAEAVQAAAEYNKKRKGKS
jgi:hypothetical protein